MRKFLLIAFLVAAAPAWAAEEPSGCDKFKWPIDRERAALTAPDRAKLNSGAELAALPPRAAPPGPPLFPVARPSSPRGGLASPPPPWGGARGPGGGGPAFPPP